jgi:class 3 adenylate cyclase
MAAFSSFCGDFRIAVESVNRHEEGSSSLHALARTAAMPSGVVRKTVTMVFADISGSTSLGNDSTLRPCAK